MMIIPETYHFEVVSVLLIKSFVNFRSSYEEAGHLFRLLFIYLRFENPTTIPRITLKKASQDPHNRSYNSDPRFQTFRIRSLTQQFESIVW